jgi:hypothetical protein
LFLSVPLLRWLSVFGGGGLGDPAQGLSQARIFGMQVLCT